MYGALIVDVFCSLLLVMRKRSLLSSFNAKLAPLNLWETAFKTMAELHQRTLKANAVKGDAGCGNRGKFFGLAPFAGWFRAAGQNRSED